MMRKICLPALLLALLLPVASLVATIVDSGTCGSAGDEGCLTWTLDSDGLLTVSGNGNMAENVWKERSDIKKVILESGVKSIGIKAFYRCTSLQSVTIQGNINDIGNMAFYFCTGLQSVTVQGSIGYIREQAFYACTSLNSLTITGGIYEIREDAFHGCQSLNNLTITASLRRIGKAAFFGCLALKDIWFCGTQKQWSDIPKGSDWAVNTPKDLAVHAIASAGAGTEADPYLIRNEADWNALVDFIANASTDTAGLHFRLNADISVTAMLGTKDHSFSGTFDGTDNGTAHTLTFSAENTDLDERTAPFAYVKNAVIKNLRTAGEITGSSDRASGLIGENDGTSTVANCRVSMAISGGAFLGGFCIGAGDSLSITGCVYDGKIQASKQSGGFAGWSTGGLSITDCLFAPAEGSSLSGGTFWYKGDGDGTLTNSYTLARLGSAQGRQAYSLAAGEGVSVGIGAVRAEYPVGGVTFCETGFKYGGAFYACAGDGIRLRVNKTVKDSEYVRYMEWDGTPLARGIGKTWLMPGRNVTVRAEIKTIPAYGTAAFTLPTGIKTAKENAFAGIGADVVYVPDGCAKLKDYAFSACPNLRKIRFPKDCEIEDAVFYGCAELIAIYAPGGGTTRQWAKDNGVPFMPMDGEGVEP